MYIQVRVEGSAGTREIGHIAGPSHKPRPNLCAHFREGEERGGRGLNVAGALLSLALRRLQRFLDRRFIGGILTSTSLSWASGV